MNLRLTVLSVSLLFHAYCSGSSTVDIVNNLQKPEFPSSADDGSGSGSGSTNYSQKVHDPRSGGNALSGAGFVAPPQMNNYGGAGLSYPIDAPAGRAGIQPQVQLQYSSSGGDGIAGVGWGLSVGMASGSVARMTSYGQLYYDKRDYFAYNGRRLIKVSGSATSENGIYRLEIESGAFLRLELANVENGGTWTVRDTGGNVTLLGASQAARVYKPGFSNQTYSWHFSSLTDKNGNWLSAEYDAGLYQADRVLYLKEIRYTGNANQALDAKQYVRFTYRSRSKPFVSTAPGFVTRMTKLLDRISVGWDGGGLFGSELWKYDIIYDTSPDSGRPILKTVDSNRTSTKPEFQYSRDNHTLAWQLVNNPFLNDTSVDPNEIKYFEGDFNGDGLSDMVFFNPNTGDWKAVEKRPDGGYNFKTYAQRFQGFKTEDQIQFFKGNVTGDYNGDGRSDIAMYLPAKREFWVAEHDGQVFQFRHYGVLPFSNLDLAKAEWFPGDFDGNGLSDVVLFQENTGKWIYMRNVGGAFTFQIFSQHFQNLFRGDYRPNANFDSAVTNDRSPFGEGRSKAHFLMGDYNGDGRTDIALYDERDNKWWVAENKIDSSYVGTGVGFKLDWKLYKVFTAPEAALMSHERFSGDFNGDGLSDFLIFDRASGQWWLGETAFDIAAAQGTINFRIYSNSPQFKTITRWLQGDFNGDGQTDVGFYSKDDNNFWIGEATNAGFRYRIYNNLANGPDAQRLLAAAPLPKDEVKIAYQSAVVAAGRGNGAATFLTDFKFNGNRESDRGEIPYLGCFSSATNCTAPELVIYNRQSKGIYFKKQTDTGISNPVFGIDLDAAKGTFFFEKDNMNFSGGGGAELLYYRKTGIPGFSLLRHNGSEMVVSPYADLPLSDNLVQSFSETESVVLADYFTTNTERELLILDDLNSENSATSAVFHLFRKSSAAVQVLNVNTLPNNFQPATLKGVFSRDPDDRVNRRAFEFFSGQFLQTAGNAKVLFVDNRAEAPAWYLGTISNGAMDFEALTASGDVSFPNNVENILPKRTRSYQGVSGQALLYANRASDGRWLFHRVRVDETFTPKRISVYHYGPLDARYDFRGEIDGNGALILRSDDGIGYSRMSFGGDTNNNYQIDVVVAGQNGYSAISTIERPDLVAQFYPFTWIQGDYNGDNKTDLGFFHLKEPKWIFANTVGVVPDLLTNVKNGIGGAYELEYVNSTTLDNNGPDGIPHLPVNYKVCTKLTIDDGFGNRMATTYQYKGGFAFSQFIPSTGSGQVGRKETDYFGFSEFRSIDAYGSKTISLYNTNPSANFMENRALGGALKETRYLGYDNQEYSKSTVDYSLTKFTAGTASSYMAEAVASKKYVKGILVQSSTTASAYDTTNYRINNRTSTATDHYSDAARPSTTVQNYAEYISNTTTNQQFLYLQKSLKGSAHEVTQTNTFDSRGNAIQQISSYTGNGLTPVPDRVITIEYDGFGNKVADIDRSATPNRRVDYVYDTDLFQFVIKKFVSTGSVVLETNSTINYGAAFGAAETMTDANGRSAHTTFDSLGRVISVERDTGNGMAQLVEITYSTDLPLSAKTKQFSGLGASADVTSRTYVDGIGRPLQMVTSALNTSGKRYVKTGRIAYDAAGRPVRQGQRDWALDDEIDKFRLQTTERNPTVTEYDSSGRVKKVALPPAYAGEPETSINTVYNDPYEVVTTHATGQGKRSIQNGRGQILFAEDFGPQLLGGTDKSLKSGITFCYDLAGNRIKKMESTANANDCSVDSALFNTKDTLGSNIAVWEYDGFGQLRRASDPDFGVSLFSYTPFGEIASKTDAKAQTTNYSYDRLGRITQKQLPNGEGTTVYTYDALAGSQNALGRLVRVSDSASVRAFSYDAMGRVASEIRQISGDANTYTTNMRYDLFDRQTEVDYPADPRSGQFMRVCYDYNNFGYANGVAVNYAAQGSFGCASASKPIVSSIDYNEFGQANKINYGNGISKEFTYDVRGRVSTMEFKNAVQSWAVSQYQYELNNSIRSVTTTPSQAAAGANFMNLTTSHQYTYDGLNRLAHAVGNATPVENATTTPVAKQYEMGFAYAANGNLLQKDKFNPTSHTLQDRWSYSYTNHAVTGITATGFSGSQTRFDMDYDGVGNMVMKRDKQPGLTKNMDFTSDNRISRVTDQNGQVVGQYLYDDSGFRVKKIASGPDITATRTPTTNSVEVTLPNRFFAIEVQKTAAGAEIANTYNVVNNVYLNGLRVAAVVPGGTARYFFTDQVDSVSVVADDNGNGVSHTEFLPFGETWFQEPNGTYAPKYNSQELDRESQFYFYNARHYDPQLARFTSVDTKVDGINSAVGWNGYAYVRNNPILYKDPTGHWASVTYEGGLLDWGKKLLSGTFGFAAWAFTAGMLKFWWTSAVHQIAIEKIANGRLDENILKRAQAVQSEIDEDQSDSVQYKHLNHYANKYSPEENRRSVMVATRKGDEFIKSNLEAAIRLKHQLSQAMAEGPKTMAQRQAIVDMRLTIGTHLGNAFHTAQDATSPVHRGMQEYTGFFNHARFESRYPDQNSMEEKQLEGATAWVLDIFNEKTSMPESFVRTEDGHMGELALPNNYGGTHDENAPAEQRPPMYYDP